MGGSAHLTLFAQLANVGESYILRAVKWARDILQLTNTMKTVMVLHPGFDHLQAQYLRGISDYAHEKQNWILQLNPYARSLDLRSLASWPGDGVIATLYTKAEILAASPVRDISARYFNAFPA